MKIIFPGISKIWEIREYCVNTIVVENPSLLLELLRDIQNQENGNDGLTIISEGEEPLVFSKNVELLSQFVPFDVNRKNLVNKATTILEKRAVEVEFFEQTQEVLSSVEKLLLDISFDMTGDICFPKLSISTMLKASGLEFANEYGSLAEAVVDYMELVCEYDHEKLFILYNIRSLLKNDEAEMFFDTVLKHGMKILCIESSQHEKLANEELYIIDKDLCEIEG